MKRKEIPFPKHEMLETLEPTMPNVIAQCWKSGVFDDYAEEHFLIRATVSIQRPQLQNNYEPICKVLRYVCFQHTQSLNFRRQHRTKCDVGGMVAKATKPNRIY